MKPSSQIEQSQQKGCFNTLLWMAELSLRICSTLDCHDICPLLIETSKNCVCEQQRISLDFTAVSRQ